MQSTSALGAFARDLRDEDLSNCLEVNPSRIGDELVGRARAVEIWKGLTRSRSFSCTVIEAARRPKGVRIVAFGAGVFVSPAFADAELSDPRRGLNSRIIASIDSGRSVVLTEAEVRSGNTRGGLDFVSLIASLRRDLLDRDGASEALVAMHFKFLEMHAGYRFHRIIGETVGQEEEASLESTRAFRMVRKFEEPGLPTRVLWVSSRADVVNIAGSIGNALFRYSEPVLRLRDADQQLLIAALRGLTDEQLSSELGVSLTAVKKRWLSIFDRTIEERPDLFPAADLHKDGQKRGRQKRHHVLAYMREHPEELRPVDL